MMVHYKLTLLPLLLLSVFIVSGCASKPKVFSDFDQRHDFTAHRTFTWVQDPPMLRAGDYIVSALTERRMTAAIKNELIAKGYTFIENQDEADFAVLYTMGAREKIKIVSHPGGFYSHRYEWGWGTYYYPYFVYFPYDRHWRYRDEYKTYVQGDIAVDMFDTETKTPIWHTKASKRLSLKDLNSHAKNAAEIATQLLQHFPRQGCVVEITKECQPFE